MKRIVEGDASNEALQQAELVAALVRRAAEVDVQLEARVLDRLHSGTRRFVPRALKPVVIAVGATTIAILIAGIFYWLHTRPSQSRSALPPPSATIAAPIVAPATPRDLPVSVEPLQKPTHSEEPHRVRPRPSHDATAAPSEDESRLLLEAYRAWRHAHDRDAALSRIDEYLRRFPHGALTEEALTIALDATGDDHTRAVNYARHYLQRFPEGPQAARAHRVVDRP